jgi:hypothetical protein
MERLTKLSNKYQKRTLRPVYAQTQATPYATSLDDAFRGTDGSVVLPESGDTTPLHTRTADAFTHKNSLVPGLVMVRTVGEKVAVATSPDQANASAVTEQPFGLLANWVGGELDDSIDEQTLAVGVWRGANHAFFEVLAPAFNDTGLSAAYSASGTSQGLPVLLYAGADGRLTYLATGTSSGEAGKSVPVARLIERVGSARILVELLV